jgi:hypothetical protein
MGRSEVRTPLTGDVHATQADATGCGGDSTSSKVYSTSAAGTACRVPGHPERRVNV